MTPTSHKNRKRKINNDARVDEAYKFMRSIQEDVITKDDFTVYGENVASRMRSSNQNNRAISIAKHQIDNILFQLEMGAFAAREVVMPDPRSHHPAVFYPPQASPTSSSASMIFDLTSSSPSPSPSVASSQSLRSYHISQPQYPARPQSSNQNSEGPVAQHVDI